MARGGFYGKGRMGGGGMGNMQQMMAQAQKMQQDMARVQEELENKEVEASSGGGMVSVKANGKKEVISISIKPEAVDPDDVEMLEDLVMAAVNEALRTAEAMAQSEMAKVTGGMDLGGLL
ncbi:MAG: YbaB/EbfC family nucleoid-associated protein [Christensenellales bacterium]|jgi:DNA-binding YbaB/EbfC family protein